MKKLLKNKFLTRVRNYLNFKPVKINIDHIPKNAPVSDFFPWRLDNNFETFFRFSDYPKIFQIYDKTYVTIFIFNSNGKLILEKVIDNIKISNEIKISNFIQNSEKYGSFLVFFGNKKKDQTFSLRNSCYTGFSKLNNLSSFVHGNVPVAYYHNNKVFNDIIGVSLKKNNIYSIQDSLEGYEKVELFFSNPTSSKIFFKINGLQYTLKKNESKIIDVTIFNNIVIKSNCYLLRPYIFKYNKNFLDVHHG